MEGHLVGNSTNWLSLSSLSVALVKFCCYVGKSSEMVSMWVKTESKFSSKTKFIRMSSLFQFHVILKATEIETDNVGLSNHHKSNGFSKKNFWRLVSSP